MIISNKITEAIEFCSQAHEGQKRKQGIPYVSHPVSVGFILQSAGYSEEVIIAGILHDVLEDTDRTEGEISEIFGKQVVDLIKGVTENTNIKVWQEKKRKYIENLKNVNNDIKAISAADLLDNTRAMVRALNNGFNIWEKFSVAPEEKINYIKSRFEVIRSTLSNEITDQIEQALLELERLKP